MPTKEKYREILSSFLMQYINLRPESNQDKESQEEKALDKETRDIIVLEFTNFILRKIDFFIMPISEFRKPIKMVRLDEIEGCEETLSRATLSSVRDFKLDNILAQLSEKINNIRLSAQIERKYREIMKDIVIDYALFLINHLKLDKERD